MLFQTWVSPWYKQKGERQSQANYVGIDNKETVSNTNTKGALHVSQIPNVGSNQFTQEQINQIQKMIQETKYDIVHKVNNFVGESSSENFAKGNRNYNFWIVDTGATDHVSYSKSHFIIFERIKPIHVKLPNGSYVISHFNGIVKLFDNFYINNVLYILDFSLNLIFVQRITESHNCKLIFLPSVVRFEICSPGR